MLIENFFLKFFKYKQNSSQEIVQYNSNEKFALQDQIKIKIQEVNNEISKNSQALVEAQVVKFRSAFSRSNNFIDHIGKSVYKTKLEDSINWHQKQLKELYLKRRELETSLEKLKGIFWLNQIKRILRITLIIIFIFLSLLIFLSGFMMILYLSPFIILILLVYLISTKRY